MLDGVARDCRDPRDGVDLLGLRLGSGRVGELQTAIFGTWGGAPAPDGGRAARKFGAIQVG